MGLCLYIHTIHHPPTFFSYIQAKKTLFENQVQDGTETTLQKGCIKVLQFISDKPCLNFAVDEHFPVEDIFCVVQPANRCFAQLSLVKITFS